VPAAIAVVRQAAPTSTVFENRYTPQGRTQRLHAQAPPVDLQIIPSAWHAASIVHLGPIMQDVPLEALARFPDALVGVTPQGWLRTVRGDKIVALEPWRLLDLPWRHEQVVVLSEEDVEHDEALVQQLSQQLDIVVLTRAERGATVWHRSAPTHVSAFSANAVDPTGAGDVFAAAFLAALHKGQPPIDATRWACAVAAFAIERPGITTLPQDDQIRQRLLGQ
jgi:sugar/nucleoside kinase (ribokinase family)